MSGAAQMQPTASIVVNLFNGERQPITPDVNVLITIRDGNQQQVLRKYYDAASIRFEGLTFFDNFGDDYSVIASASGYMQSGFFPVHVSPDKEQNLDLMLLPNEGSFNFTPWADLQQKNSRLFDLLSHGASPDGARDRYGDLMEKRSPALAALLNITAALNDIPLPNGRTPLSYYKDIVWNDSLQQDRFFAFVDRTLIDQIRAGREQGLFEPALTTLHPNATGSFKEIRYGEANVQFTFHENETKTVDNVECVIFDTDIDYYRDKAAHVLLEVIPNPIFGLTNPQVVYMLRWIAERRVGRDFDPLYTIQAPPAVRSSVPA